MKSVMNPILLIENLSLSIQNRDKKVFTILDKVSLRINSGEILGLVGDSGSGKTMLARSILRLFNASYRTILEGHIYYYNEGKMVDLLESNHTALSIIRQEHIGFVFQHSMQVLNPIQTLGDQILEKMTTKSKSAVVDLLEEVMLIPAERYYKAYPHQVSGGELQRCLIALALVNNPKLLIADEPLSALDQHTSFEILNLIKRLTQSRKLCILFISHDIKVVKEICSNIAFMSDGRIIADSVNIDENPHTNAGRSDNLPPFSLEHVILEVSDLNKSYSDKGIVFRKINAVKSVIQGFGLKLHQGEILGIVGVSGSGKSTLARILARLESYDSGIIKFKTYDFKNFTYSDVSAFRKQSRIIFQDPHSSMPPHLSVRYIMTEAAKLLGITDSVLAIKEAFIKVNLAIDLLDRLPRQLSGGQQQRVLIARALLGNPSFLICDEILSSLDATVQEKIIKCLINLNVTEGISILFISHDLPVVTRIAHDIIEMPMLNN